MKIHYVTGSRADFGLMASTLRSVNATGRHRVEVVVTGQHLVGRYGHTVSDVREFGLPIAGEISVALSGASGYEMARAIAGELAGLSDLWLGDRPDLVLVLGDRGEMLAAAIAAVCLNIHVAHIHGGERSGTIDEGVRHAITKLSHFHLAATQGAADRIVRMGEDPSAVQVIGAPGLVDICGVARGDRRQLAQNYGLSPDLPLALTIFHPVVQEADKARGQVISVVEAVASSGYAQIVMRPNSDAGGQYIDDHLSSLTQGDRLRVITHLNRSQYLQMLAGLDLLVGNSSSGVIESASFALRCVNVGSRQAGRERNSNTVDCRDITVPAVRAAIAQAEALHPDGTNVYGGSSTGELLIAALDSLDLDPAALSKMNAY